MVKVIPWTAGTWAARAGLQGSMQPTDMPLACGGLRFWGQAQYSSHARRSRLSHLTVVPATDAC